MEIDLTKIDNFTLESVTQLIASKDDSEHHQIRVTENGILFLSDDVGNINLDDIRFVLETWDAGNGYVGWSAALDEVWVERIYQAIKQAWEKGDRGYIDWY